MSHRRGSDLALSRVFSVAAVATLLCSAVVATIAMSGDTRDPTSTDLQDDSSEDNRRKWTIAMYWASDNNLDEYTEYFIGLWI